jgi:AcrR family transcriptional regulator
MENASDSLISTSKRRRERERQALTDRILDVAREMFVRDGYEAVTLNKIAEAIEYTPGAIYQYFKDKRSLVMAIIRADYVSLRDEILQSKDIPDPLERLIQMAQVYARWGAAHPNHYRLMTMPPPAWAESGRELREDVNPPIEQDALYFLGSVVAEGFEAGLVRDEYDNPGVVAMTLWAGIHGVVMQEIMTSVADRALLGASGVTYDARVQTMIDVLVRGFLKPGSVSR